MNGVRGCRAVRRLLPLFPSRELPRADGRRVREHLAACPACRRELRSWMDVDAALASATGPEEPPHGSVRPDAAFFADLERRVLAAVSRSEPAARGVRIGTRRTVGAAVAAALFVGGFFLGARLLVPDAGSRPRLLDLAPLAGDRGAPVIDGARLRPVGLRAAVGTDTAAWTGLRGRSRADQLLDERVILDVGGTAPVPGRVEDAGPVGDGRR